MIKEELRKLYLSKRKDLSDSTRANFDLQLYNLFFSSIDLSFIKVLHTYLPLEKNHEPDTWMIIDRVKREHPHIRISIPRVGPDDNLENFYFEGLHQIVTSKWGIPEPKQGIPTPTEKIDLVIVPLLAFDKSGHRIGYGKGFYDRFLTSCRTDCLRMGLSYFDAIEAISDTDAHDIALSMCLTPTQVLHF